MRLHRFTGPVAVLAGVAMVAAGLMTPAAATSPGNNGTVKVDGWEVDNTPANEPHVGCAFGIDFYGYEANLPATMVFEVQPPTGDAVIFTQHGTLDNDDASGGGSEAGHDGHFAIDLTDALAAYVPHPQQGFHLKLTVTVDDGNPQGAQVKHKVFWATGCVPPTTTTTTTTTTVPETTTTSPATTTTVPETTTTLPGTTTTLPEVTTTLPEVTTTLPEVTTTLPGTTTTSPGTTLPGTTVPEATSTTTSPNVAPQVTTKPPTKGTEVLGVELARTGIGSELLIVGAVLVLAGAALELVHLVTRRRTEAV